MKIFIVTVATEKKFYMPYLEESIKKNNGNLIILGLGQKWQGFNWRNKLMLDFLKTIDPDDIVCFVDGYDVICVRDLREITDVFLQLKKKNNCKIVVAENKIIMNNLFNIYNFIKVKIIFDKCINKLINSGTYIGHVKDVLYVLKQVYTGDNTLDDQKILVKYCKSNPNDIYIDLKKRIIFND